MKNYIMVIDEGTTGTRALLFNKDFQIVSQSYVEFTQYTPAEDRVEHDALEIYEKTIAMCKKAMEQVGASAKEISAIGITNQRATSVIWDKETGLPICKAIVWQDSRTANRCAQINESEWGKKAKNATGWTVAPVYSSLMIEWLMKNNEEVAKKLLDGSALFGTIDTWLVWKLTGGKRHTISYSNASVTGSLDLRERIPSLPGRLETKSITHWKVMPQLPVLRFSGFAMASSLSKVLPRLKIWQDLWTILTVFILFRLLQDWELLTGIHLQGE